MQGTGGLRIGEKGVKYGLQKPGASKAIAPRGAAGAPKQPVSSMFGDDDSDEDVGAQIARQAEKKRSAAKVQQMYEDALAQDPSVFDYDGVYDEMQAARVQPKQQEKIERKSRYIAQLKDQADARKREQDIMFERRQLKERAKEDHLFGDKEKFVTSAYRKKLEEDKKWLEMEKKREEEEAKQDVRKIGHMGNFYANLLTGNVAYGAAKSGNKTAAEAEDKAEAEEGAAAAAEPRDQQQQQVPPAGGKQPQLDRYDVLRMEAEQALVEQRQREREQQQGPGGAAAQPPEEQQQQPASVAAPAAPAQEQQQGPGAAAAAAAGGSDAAAAAGAATPLAGKRRNDDTSVMSARERYLARKKQQLG